MTWMNWVSPGPILPSTSEHRQILLALSGVSRHSLARSLALRRAHVPGVHPPSSCHSGSALAGPAHKTVWPGQPLMSCRSLRLCQLLPWPVGGTNRLEKEAGSGTSPAEGKQSPDTLPFPRPTVYPYHARRIVRSHSPLKAMGTVDNDQALFSRHPKLL